MVEARASCAAGPSRPAGPGPAARRAAPVARPAPAALAVSPGPGGAGGLQRLGRGQRRRDARLAVRRGADLRGALAPVGGARIGLDLAREPRHLGRRRHAEPLEGGPPPERRRPGARPHPHAVLRHPVEPRHPGGQQRRETVDEQPLQERPLADAEVRQRLVVDAHAPAQPLEGDMLLAEPRQLARAAHPFDRRVEPERRQHPRIGRRMPRAALHRSDRVVERREVEALGEGPHQPDPMLGRHQVVEAQRPQLNLPALRPPKPRTTALPPRRRRMLGKRPEQPIRLVCRHVALREILAMTILLQTQRRDSRSFIHRL